MSVEIYGIRNCGTMKKAFVWLEGHGVSYDFHDYKKEGIRPEQLAVWADRVGWDKLINRAGTTFRGLPQSDKDGLDRERAMALMVAKPSMIRRPVIVTGDDLIVGFDESQLAQKFGSHG